MDGVSEITVFKVKAMLVILCFKLKGLMACYDDNQEFSMDEWQQP